MRGLRSERNANADLVRALVRCIRNDAIDADNGERQSQQTHAGREARSNFEHEEAIERLEPLRHGLYIKDRKRGGHAGNGLLHGGNDGLRLARTANLKRHDG